MRDAIARAPVAARAAPTAPAARRRPRHPNAPADRARAKPGAGRTGRDRRHRRSTEEVEVIALLADHPSLIATAEADKAFWLLTDARLRAMYSAARAGQSFHELAPVHLPTSTAEHVLSGKYAEAKDPRAALVAMTQQPRASARPRSARTSSRRRSPTRSAVAIASSRGSLAQLAEAERKGDHELVARLEDSLEIETSTRKAGRLDMARTPKRRRKPRREGRQGHGEEAGPAKDAAKKDAAPRRPRPSRRRRPRRKPDAAPAGKVAQASRQGRRQAAAPAGDDDEDFDGDDDDDDFVPIPKAGKAGKPGAKAAGGKGAARRDRSRR